MSEEKEHFCGLSAEPQPINANPWWLNAAIEVLCFACLGVILALAIKEARAEPRFQVTNQDITITLYDEPCELKDQITNLPYKATWQEKGKTFQGCFGPRPDVGAVMFYFDDRTVGLIPFDALKKVVGV